MSGLKQLSENSYHLLGLDISSDFKSIVKRCKELNGLLKIDEHRTYPLDIDGLKGFRTEILIKQAQEKLSNPRQKIKEYFFWFCKNDEIDITALSKIETKNYIAAMELWKKAIETNPENNLIYKKNLCVLYLILLASKNHKELLITAVKLLHELVDKKWKQYTLFYKLYDEYNIDEQALSQGNFDIKEWLADFFTSLSQEANDKDYIVEFQNEFNLNIGKINAEIIQPIAGKIHSLISKLNSMNICEDGFFDKDEAQDLKRTIKALEDELNRIIEVGLYEDGFVCELRDKIAESLRGISIDLANQLRDFSTSSKLTKIAQVIASSQYTSSKLSQDLFVYYDHLNTTNLLSIPESLNHLRLIFKSDKIQFNNQEIYYRDILGVSYQMTSRTTDTTYTFNITSQKETINIVFSSFFSNNNDEKTELFCQLISITDDIIQPIMIRKIIYYIFNKDKEFEIGNVTFSRQGYFKKSLGKTVSHMVKWSDIEASLVQGQAVLASGDMCLFENSKGSRIIFERIPIGIYNAIFIPELVNQCYLRAKV